MKSRIGAAAFAWMSLAGCGAGAEGDLAPGAEEGVQDGAGSGESEVSAAPGAATACPGVTATLQEHWNLGRATAQLVPFFFFNLTFYYATSPQKELLGSDPNQRVTLYPASTGFTSNASLCQGGSICGDGVRQGSEECDGTALGSATCASLGYLGGGPLTCSATCHLDISQCTTVCNNGVLEPTELCDVPGAPAPEPSCAAHSSQYASGTVTCNADCGLDTSACRAPACGNGVREGTEQCDGGDLGSISACRDFMPHLFEGGTLGCTPECTYDMTPCERLCGNGRLDPGEACDGTTFGPSHAGKTCADVPYSYPTWPFPIYVNYASGNLACSSSCGVDFTDCKPRPGCYTVAFKGQIRLVCY